MHSAEIGVLDEALAWISLGRAFGQNAALVQHGDAFGEIEHRVHVVLDQHQSAAVADVFAAGGSCRRAPAGSCRPGARRAAARLARSRARGRSRGAASRHRPDRPPARRRGAARSISASVASTSSRRPGTRRDAAQQIETESAAAFGQRRDQQVLPHRQLREKLVDLIALGQADWQTSVTFSWVISRPAKKICPALGSTSPVSILKNVLLPAPLGPMTPRSSPSRDREIDVAVGDDAAVVLGEAARLQNRLRRPGRRLCPVHRTPCAGGHGANGRIRPIRALVRRRRTRPAPPIRQIIDAADHAPAQQTRPAHEDKCRAPASKPRPSRTCIAGGPEARARSPRRPAGQTGCRRRRSRSG